MTATTHPSAATPPSASASAPTLIAAFGMIALYFVLQLAAGTVVSIVLGAIESLSHPGLSFAVLDQRVQAILRQPDSNALFVIIGLPLIALATLGVVHRIWPTLWSLQQPPGFGFAPATSMTWYAVALAFGLLMPPIGGLLTQLLAHGETVAQNVEELSRHAPDALRLPLAMVMVVVGPLIEELLFRGVLLSALMRRMHAGWAIAMSAIVFGAVHLDGLDFKWYALPGLILLAAGLAWLRLKSSSLWPAVLAHSVYNLFALIALFATANFHI